MLETAGWRYKDFSVPAESCASRVQEECWEKVGGYDEQMKTGYKTGN
jgi:hypothetical protein